jgi:hypothetical protein
MSGTVHNVSTKITPNFRKDIIRALHCGFRTFVANFNYSRRHPANEKTNIRERSHDTQQHQGLLTTGLNPRAAHISRKCIFFLNRSSSSFIARLRKGGDDLWKTVRVSMSGVT